MNSSKETEKRKSSPILKANFVSKWFFWWTYEIFGKGLRGQLEAKDLYEHVPNLASKNVSSALVDHWEKEKRRKKPNLMHMIFQAYGWTFVPISIIYSLLEISIHTVQPLFLGNFVLYFTEGQTTISTNGAFLYGTGIVVCALVGTLCFHPFMFHLFEVGARFRLACSGLVYNKCLRSAVTAENSGISGFAISVLSTDLPQFDLTFYFFYDLWKGPVECCIFGYIMYREIGWPAIVGIAAIVIFIPLQAWAAKYAAHFKLKSSGFADERVKLMNEIITAIQIIKMYAWEKSFAKLIAKIRKNEIGAIRGSMNIYASLQCTGLISKLALFLSLVSYVYTGEIVTARKVFIISSYYNLLNNSLLNYWPLAITTWMETIVCARRIVIFLMQNEKPNESGVDNFAADSNKMQSKFSGRTYNPNASEKSLIIKDLSATWDCEALKQRQKHIRNVSCHIPDNKFVGVIGNVGVGKSTLLNAILGELLIEEGSLEVNGIISYASQESWIFEATVRDNIVFVEPYDEQRYHAVIDACELKRDMELLPHGDYTIVGERGTSLSGGQKARINLARAVYRRADIYMFDDPLSAVDAYVGKRLVEKCFLKFLRDKIRIVVTHRVQHLKKADHIILMEDGTITRQGTYEQLKTTIHFRVHLDNENEPSKDNLNHRDSLIDRDREHKAERIITVDHGEERKELAIQGSVKLQTYGLYFKALGMVWVIIILFILFILARTFQAATDIFISKWATWEESLPIDDESFTEYAGKREKLLLLYTVLIISTLVLYIARTFGFFYACLKISLRLHDRLFRGIIRAWMFFFNTNPSGRILNRFSSDIANIDVSLPQAMFSAFSFYVDVVAVLLIVALANVWLLLPAIIVLGLFYGCRLLYLGASRVLKRIESITRSPLYSQTNQTFHGLTTIRALNATQQMENEFHDHQNVNTSALYLYIATNRAFAFWTDLICVLYIFLVTFSFLLFDRNFQSGDVGLAITQSMTLVIMCQWGMRQTAEMENNMTSVERVIEYANTPSEPPLETDPSVKLPANWPSAGCIQFNDLRLRYSEKSDYILQGLTMSVKSMEKIGIVGRTGAGKSSIIQALFRLAINEGLIIIDDFNIESLGLHDLRSHMSIIPQDPILFSGTLRFNLDPFEQRTDEEMWKALEDVKLKDYISQMDGGLNCCVYDGGSNFSMGQRQLLCMARAILRCNKILIMDEATANVDTGTDNLIQETIRTKFGTCTVLTIAHRLHTVMDNDRVLVMDAGQAVELGHPFELLQNPSGYFHKLVEKTGPGTARYLKQMAQESYQRRTNTCESEIQEHTFL